MNKLPLTSRIGKKTKLGGAKALSRAKEFINSDLEATQTNPERITNDTVAKHREEVLSGARRFIYPMKHSKHRIAIISSFIVGIVFISLVTFTWFLLYKQQSIGDFAYRISQIVPFPVARVDGSFVKYEEYLFELRQNVHYLSNQENVDFKSPEGKIQLAGLKNDSMQKVIGASVIRKIAKEKGVSVSSQEVDEQIDLIRSQGGIGNSENTLEDTLQDFYGWSLGDLRRVIKAQVLKQKLIPILDEAAKPNAQIILQDITNGKDFAQAAKDNSQDELSKANGGELGYVFRSNTELPPQIVEKAFTLASGQVADELVETLFGYHIIKNVEYRSPDEAKVAHILIRFTIIETFINARLAEVKTSKYIHLP